ncbi:hypothetical protein, partial [Salmonella sp. s54836]|uniref:hypothetical protein n=1 Tax=Salmonella sp. s54836 TaxID=3159673 RepID=UPI00397F32CB
EPLEDIPEASVSEEFDETLDNGLLKHTPIIVNNQQFNILQDEKETTKAKDILIPPKVKEESEYEKMKMESKVLHSDKTKETMHKKELKKLIN